MSLAAIGQGNVSMVLEKEDPTCSGNGQINASLNRAENITGLTFELFLLPELETAVNTAVNGDFQNLQAGNYLVKAIFELSEENTELTEEISLTNQTGVLSFTILSNYLCQNDLGAIEVVVNSGNAATYELDGPVSRPPQENPIFEDLPEGIYNVVVVDGCGDRLSQTFQIQNAPFVLDEEEQVFLPELESCEAITVGHYVQSVGATIAYPLEMAFLISAPDGSQETVTTEILEGDPQEALIYGTIPFYEGEVYQYDLTVRDNCGQTATVADYAVNRELTISDDLFWGAGGCGQRRLSVKPENFTAPFTINFLEVPAGFTPESFNEQYPGPFTEDNIFFGTNENPIPGGNYELEVIDACGRQASVSRNLIDNLSGPSPTVYKGCGPNTGSVRLNSFDYELTAVYMSGGPTTYSGTYPINFTSHINPNDPRSFFINGLPSGTFQFYSYTTCGSEHTTSVTIEGVEAFENELEVIENCGSFNLFLNHRDNLSDGQTTRFGLQKQNPETGEWGHPGTGEVYVEGNDLNGDNSVILTNGATNINLNYSGELRVIKSIRIWKNGSEIQPDEPTYTFCLETLNAFSIKERSTFNAINTFQCATENYEVFVNASGYEPIVYRIVAKNGNPFLIENGENPLFENLEAGRYQLQLEDNCGNLTNTNVQLIGENLPKIIPNNLCEGENGTLSIKNLDFLQFEWFRDDDPENILSTNSQLEFSPFNLETDQGLYKVRLRADNPESCLNEVLEFNIDENSLNPFPGAGVEAQICEGEIVDLFDYLEGPFNNFGNWEEISNSGTLIGNIWSTIDLEPGTYEFQYTISGICSGENSTRVTFTLNQIPPPPSGNPLQRFCGPVQPTVEDLVAEGENILWFSQEDDGQILDPGWPLQSGRTYFAQQTVNGCPSERFPVEIAIYPPISNNTIQQSQTLYQMEQPETLLGSVPSGGTGEYLFQWEIKTGQADWVEIENALQEGHRPAPLLESSYFRRKVIDEACGEHYSNEVLVTVQIAAIRANTDTFGPLRNFEENRLASVLENDTFEGELATGNNVTVNISEITDDSGNLVNLDLALEDNGEIILPAGTPPGNYTLQYNICQTLVPDNCDRGQVNFRVAALDLDIQKEVDKTQAVEGEMATYTITLENNSPFPLESIRVTDEIPEGLMLLSSSVQGQSANTWILNDLGIGESFEIQLEVMAMEAGEFTNTVRVESGDLDTLVQSEVLSVRLRSVDLVATKISTGEETRDGDEFTYQIRIENLGPDAATNVKITDLIPSSLILTDILIGGSLHNMISDFTDEGNQLQWVIDVFPVGESLNILLTVRADDDGNVINRINVLSDDIDANPKNNLGTDEKIILPIFIPNVIKPDGSGKNDSFIIRATHKYDKIKLLIFNRWGDLVYKSDDYDNSWAADGLLGGTYYYQIEGINQRGGIKQYKGWLQVIKEK